MCERPDVATWCFGPPQWPTGWKSHGILAGFLKDLADVCQEHGRDTMLHTAKTPPATFFEAPNECAIYLLRSLLRQTSCWVSAITGGTGLKITGPPSIFGEGKTGTPIYMELRNRGPHFL